MMFWNIGTKSYIPRTNGEDCEIDNTLTQIQPTFYSTDHPGMIGELPIWMTFEETAMSAPIVNQHGVLIWDHPERGVLLFKAKLDESCGKYRWVQFALSDVDKHEAANHAPQTGED